MKHHATLPALFTTATLLTALPCIAQENDPQPTQENTIQPATVPDDDSILPGYTDPLIVTPSGFSQQSFDTPYVVDVVGRDEIRDFGIRSVPESLQYTPGIMVQRTGHGQGSPYIRGFTGFRNVLLIDGVRLNNSVFRDGPNQYWNTIDPFSVERLEVIKGPASVIYGSDAIGGTVNVITNSPFGYGDGNNLAGRTTLRGATNERSIGGRAEISPTFDNTFGVLISGSFSEFGDVEGGSEVGTQVGTGYDQIAADLKFEYFIGDYTRMVIAHQQFRQNNVPRTHRTVDAIMWEGLTQGNDQRRELDQERDLTYVQLQGEGFDGNGFNAYNIGVSYQNTYEERDRVTGGGAQRYQDVRVQTFGVFAQARSQASEQTSLTYGFDYYHDEVGSSSNTNPIQGPVGDDASYDLLGIYVQSETQINDRTTVVLGGRWNYAAAQADSVQDPATLAQISIDDSWNSMVGSARILYDLEPERLLAFGGVSQGFRAPNLSDLTRLDTARTNEIETPSPGLDPEFFYAFEAGLKGQGSNYGWQASYFYTLVDDQIIRFPTGDVIAGDDEVTKANVGDGYINGIELDGMYMPTDHLTLFANGTWMLGEVDTFPTAAAPLTREYIDRNMPLTVSIGARYDVPHTPYWVYAIATGAAEARFLSTRDRSDDSRIPPGGTPGYAVLSVGGGAEISENLILSVTLENLTNEDYRIHGSGVNAPGFGGIVTLEWTF